MRNFVFWADRPSVEENGKVDYIFLMLTLLLWGLGLYAQYVCTQEKALAFFGSRLHFFYRHLKFSAIALSLMTVVAVVPMKFIKKTVVIMTGVVLLLCLVTIFWGETHKGANRWLSIGGNSFQPSEFVKFTIVLYLSLLFVNHSKEYEQNEKEYLTPFFVLFLFVALVFGQRDFSTGLFIFVIGMIMLIICGANVLWFVPFVILAFIACILMVVSEEYRLYRVLSFLHPERFADSYAFQLNKSLNAISAGGFWGTGMGSGMNLVPSIPEVQTDYIFAGYANSMGLLGVTAYVVILSLFALRGFKIAFFCPNKFAAYSSFGLVFVILLQSIVNIAVVSGTVPTTGIPLPFFSAGGSSLITTMAMCGFILNASHCHADEEEYGLYVKKEDDQLNDDVYESFNGVIVENE